MKKIIAVFTIALCIAEAGTAQTIFKRAKDRAIMDAGNKTDQRVDVGVDSAFSKTERAIAGVFKKKDRQKQNKQSDNTGNNNNPALSSQEPSTTVASPAVSTNAVPDYQVGAFADFVPGANLLFSDDFSADALGDFPAKWNTNGSGRVVTIDGLNGRWFEVVHNSVVNPLMNKELPENCTIQFDLFLRAEGQRSTPFIQFGITHVKDVLKEDLFYSDRFFVNLARYTENEGKTVEYGLKNDVVGNKSDFPLTDYTNKVLHVAIALNKTRIRLYLDEKKLIDLPRAISAGMRNNFFLNNNYIVPASELGMLVSNVRIASAETDSRSLLVKQLIDEGKAVTNEIHFDNNSDVIKPESFALINELGEAIKSNPTLSVLITGHTDAIGTPAANQQLSERRAASVKKYLLTNFSIADGRIQTNGKGSSQPVADNNSASGKAKNRRVEFTKR